MKLKIEIGDQTELEVEEQNNQILLNNAPASYDLTRKNEKEYLLTKDNKVYNIVVVSESGNQKTLNINGQEISLNVKDHITQILEDLGMDTLTEDIVNEVTAPMPGAIIDVSVSEGQEINAGDTLLILEAMKMENIIKSPVNGVIQKIHIEKGNNVEKNQVLISF